MVHPISHSGVIWVNWIFSTNHVGTWGLVLVGDSCKPACPQPVKVFIFVWDPLILVMSVSELHLDSDQLEDEPTL